MTWLEGYQQVEDRLREFWGDHPRGRVLTSLIDGSGTQPTEVILFRADIWCDRDGASRPDASGFAHQRILADPPKIVNKKTGEVKINENAPEWTSPWEVAETSAIGRALANLGYAPKGARPSREEVSKASVVGPAPNHTPDSRPATDSSSAASVQGKDAVADLGGGGGSAVVGTAPSQPPPKKYPADPINCSHRFPSGNPLSADEAGNCPKCGMNMIAALEGTTADLGPASG